MITEMFQNGITNCIVGTWLTRRGLGYFKNQCLDDLTNVTTDMSINQLRAVQFVR